MKLVILGSGGFGRVIEDIASQLDYKCMFLDDSIPGYTLDSFNKYIGDNTYFMPAFGNNKFRMEWIKKIKENNGKLATIIHPDAYISPKTKIKEGTVILPKACINSEVIIEEGCIINLGAIIDHGCVIEEGCHICLGAIIKAENKIEAFSKIEAGEVIAARTFPVK